jgi:selenocysteine lyase/cysteine desulfurase
LKHRGDNSNNAEMVTMTPTAMNTVLVVNNNQHRRHRLLPAARKAAAEESVRSSTETVATTSSTTVATATVHRSTQYNRSTGYVNGSNVTMVY